MPTGPLLINLTSYVFDMETQTLTPAPAAVAVVAAQSDRLERARELLAEVESIETGLVRDRERLLVNAWHLGQVLCAMKDDVNHGRWLPFLAGHLPKLSERNAQRCMAFFTDNPNPKNSSDLTFSTESVRKFMLGYIPVKDRPQLDGDGPVAPVSHHLTFINQFSKWDRQTNLGHAGPRAPVDQLRRDCTPVILRLVELLDREWLLHLIEKADLAAAARTNA